MALSDHTKICFTEVFNGRLLEGLSPKERLSGTFTEERGLVPFFEALEMRRARGELSSTQIKRPWGATRFRGALKKKESTPFHT